jgi:hypothetical protein
MKYSEFIKSDLILPKKDLYTMRDVNNLLIDSLFKGKTLSPLEAIVIIQMSASYWDTDWSKSVSKTKVKLQNPIYPIINNLENVRSSP